MRPIDEIDERTMKNPSLWPVWPKLPIKNGNTRDERGFPRLGMLVEIGLDTAAPDIRFVEGNMYSAWSFEEISKAPKADVDALLAAGWVVD